MNKVTSDISPIAEAQNSLNENQGFCLLKIPNGAIRHFYSIGSSPPKVGEYLMVRGWQSDCVQYFVPIPPSKPIEIECTAAVPKATTFEEYAGNFEKYKSVFSTSTLQKSILSRIKNIERPDTFLPVDAFSKLCEERPDAFNYLLNHPTDGLWMGASPEVLLQFAGEAFQTVSLAGTQKKEKAPYQWNEKEIEEQELVSQHIRQILNESSATQLVEKGPFTAEAGNIVHLKSTFQFTLPLEMHGTELAQKLHPTPAIAGLPVSLAVETIAKTEAHNRMLYTGFIGTVSEDNIDLYVNLRCMQIHNDKITIYVGGGITAQSELNAEWEETEEKSKTLTSVIYA